MLKPTSLRARLALWHAALLALTLIGLAALTLGILSALLHRRADKTLEDYADKTARSIAGLLYQHRKEPLGRRPYLNRELQEWGRQVQVVELKTGTVLDRSDGLAGQALPVSVDARLRVSAGAVHYETRSDLGDRPVRIVSVPVQMGSEIPLMVQTAASLEGIEEALQRAGIVLLLLTPSVFILSLVGGWFLVGRSLSTVDAITRTAMAIKPEALESRIETPRSNDEIARLAAAFNEMIDRLGRSFRQIQQFSADASHELKTPLTAIRGHAEVALLRNDLSAENRAVLRNIIDSADRMTAIVENLLLLARADARQIGMQGEPVQLDEAALEAFEETEPLAHQRGVALEIGQIEETGVLGDAFWLRRILTNLLTNAVKYTPPGGTATLRVWQENGRAFASVSDTGPGIPPEHLPHIFDRFYRAESGRGRESGGAGLGLNIAQWAAEAHNGSLTVTSEVGRGSVFTLELPAAPKKSD